MMEVIPPNTWCIVVLCLVAPKSCNELVMEVIPPNIWCIVVLCLVVPNKL